jgi:hypothetical protein
MALPVAMAAAPAAILLAAVPMPGPAPFPPFSDAASVAAEAQYGGAPGMVETFDPVARAQRMAEQMPRTWSGNYQPFGNAPPIPVVLVIESLRPMGQMVDLRGRIMISSVDAPVQGNINAKSDQLDLLLLSDVAIENLQPGGFFQGQQGLSLSGWMGARLTEVGGRLQLAPQMPAEPSSDRPAPVRGLW